MRFDSQILLKNSCSNVEILSKRISKVCDLVSRIVVNNSRIIFCVRNHV